MGQIRPGGTRRPLTRTREPVDPIIEMPRNSSRRLQRGPFPGLPLPTTWEKAPDASPPHDLGKTPRDLLLGEPHIR
jgi:hypothetical protein